MALHIFARIEPRPGKKDDLRNVIADAIASTRAEPGCVRVHLYESSRGPCCFFIYAEWTDAAAFEAHAQAPHILRLAAAVEELATHSLQAARTHQIA